MARFDLDRDVFMVFKDQQGFNFNPGSLDIVCNIVLLSYNRPRMLKEAIESVLAQTYPNWRLHLLDDGSDIFDPKSVVEDFKDERLLLYSFAPQTPKLRCSSNRVAENINIAFNNMLSKELVFYLCDDDIFSPNWLTMAAQAATSFPNHVIQGETWTFNDGEDWTKEAEKGMPYAQEAGIKFELPVLWWSSGSFAHRTECVFEEGLKWRTNSDGHSTDAQFILDLWHGHQDICMINKPSYYRREHKNTLSARLGKFNEDGTWRQNFKIPPVAPFMVQGAME